MSEPPSKKAKHERKDLKLDFGGAPTTAELLQKQLHAVRSLLDVYTVEHHAVLEELYVCHASRAQSAHQQPNAAAGPGPQPSTGSPGTGPKEPSTQTPPLRLRHLLPQLHATTQQEKTQGETPAAKAPGFVVPGVTSAPEQQQQPQHTPQQPLNQPQQLQSSKQQEAPKQQQQQKQASTPSQPQHPPLPPHAAAAVCNAESQNSGAVSLDTWVGARPHAGTPQSVSQPQAQAEGVSPLPPLGARAEPAAPIHRLSVVKESAMEGEQHRDDAAQQQQQQLQQQQQKSSEAEGAATVASRGGQATQPKEGASSAGPASMDVDQGEGSAAVPGQPHAGVGKGKGASAGAGTAEAMEVEGAELQRGADSVEKEGSAKGEGAGDQQQQKQHENQQRDGDGAEVKVEGMHAGGVSTCQQQQQHQPQQQQGDEHGAAIKDEGRAVLQPGSSHEQPPQHPSQATTTSAHTATAQPTANTVAPSAIAPSAAAATATAATVAPSATPPSSAAAATATATSVPHSAATAVHAGAVSAAAGGAAPAEAAPAGRAAPAGAPAPAGEPTSSAAAPAAAAPSATAAPGSATAHDGGSHDAPPAAQSQAQGQAVLTTAPQAHEGGGDGGDRCLYATPAAQTLTAAAPAAATHPGATPSTGEIAPSVSQHAIRTLAPNLIGQYGDEVLGFGGVYHQRGVFTFGEAKGLVRDLLGSAEVRQQQQQQHRDGMQESAPAAAAAVAIAPPQGAEPPSSQSATAGAAPAPSEGVAGQSTAPLVASAEELGAWRARFVDALPQIAQLEAAASATTEQELDVEGALACLAGRTGRYLIKRTTVLLGRSTEAKGEVDVDLSCEGSSKVSRRQAYLTLEADGRFKITNAGQRLMMVNGKQVQQFESARVDHLSLIEVGDVPLLLLVNKAAVQRVQRRTRRAAA